jgi:hypothetical protein
MKDIHSGITPEMRRRMSAFAIAKEEDRASFKRAADALAGQYSQETGVTDLERRVRENDEQAWEHAQKRIKDENITDPKLQKELIDRVKINFRKGILPENAEAEIARGQKTARERAERLLTAAQSGDASAYAELQKRVGDIPGIADIDHVLQTGKTQKQIDAETQAHVNRLNRERREKNARKQAARKQAEIDDENSVHEAERAARNRAILEKARRGEQLSPDEQAGYVNEAVIGHHARQHELNVAIQAGEAARAKGQTPAQLEGAAKFRKQAEDDAAIEARIRANMQPIIAQAQAAMAAGMSQREATARIGNDLARAGAIFPRNTAARITRRAAGDLSDAATTKAIAIHGAMPTDPQIAQQFGMMQETIASQAAQIQAYHQGQSMIFALIQQLHAMSNGGNRQAQAALSQIHMLQGRMQSTGFSGLPWLVR